MSQQVTVCSLLMILLHVSAPKLHLHGGHLQRNTFIVNDVNDVHIAKYTILQALTDPQCLRRFRLSDFMTIGRIRWQSRKPYAPAAFSPKELYM
jgi:hypothetical protein